MGVRPKIIDKPKWNTQADTSVKKESLPTKGVIVPEKGKQNNFIVIKASYTDNGASGVKPLTGVQTVTLPITQE